MLTSESIKRVNEFEQRHREYQLTKHNLEDKLQPGKNIIFFAEISFEDGKVIKKPYEYIVIKGTYSRE